MNEIFFNSLNNKLKISPFNITKPLILKTNEKNITIINHFVV